MSAFLTVTLVPAGAITAGAKWSINGGVSWNNSGVTLLITPNVQADIVFQAAGDYTTPLPQTVTLSDNQSATLIGNYNALKPETLLERFSKSFQETPGKALDAEVAIPQLYFSASAMSFNFTRSARAGPALMALQNHFGEKYEFLLEGGQIASDFATQAEIDSVAASVAPLLTGSQPFVGGVPFCSGWKILERKLNSWIVRRGAGWSLQPAFDAGFISGFPSGGPFQGDVAQPEIEINGFVINGGGFTFPQLPPINIGGAYVPNIPTPGPQGGGAVISQTKSFLGSVSIHQVNDDGSLNSAMNMTGFLDYSIYSPPPTPPFNSWMQPNAPFVNEPINPISPDFLFDFVGTFTTRALTDFDPGSPGFLQSQITGNFPSSYPVDGTDSWLQNVPPPNVPQVPPYGDQFGSLPWKMILWIGTAWQDIPQVNFIPADVNAPRGAFNIDDYGTFLTVN